MAKPKQPPTDLPKLASPAERALAAAGVTRLHQLTGFTEREVGDWHGIGANALKTLREALAARGLAFTQP